MTSDIIAIAKSEQPVLKSC